MQISLEVIIIAQENSNNLKEFLDSLLSQTSLPSKVSLIGEKILIEDYESFIHVFSSRNIDFKIIPSISHSSFQKNIGIENISCDFIFFTEGNIKMDNSYFEESINFLENDSLKKIGGITGCSADYIYKRNSFVKFLNRSFYLPLNSKGKILKSGFADKINYSKMQSGEIDWLPKSNMLFRKEVFEFDWFDENLRNRSYFDDLDFSLRISKRYKLYYLSTAKFYNNSNIANSNIKEESYLSVININYVFKKNFKPGFNSTLAHYIALKGFVGQAIFCNRSIKALSGTLKGLSEIVFLKNYTLPIYLERLDYSDFRQPSIAEHFVRYDYAANFCKDKIVLDCASGEGIGMNILCKTAKTVYGVDIDENTFKTARENIKYDNAILNVGSATELPFSDNYFDIITSMETLEHIPQKLQEKCIEEFYRVLKPNGLLIISTPNKSVLNPKGLAPKNYFHLWELTHIEFKELILRHFKTVITNGLFNPVRQKTSIQENIDSDNKYRLSLKKKIMLMLPFKIKNIISIILYKRKIYPLKSEYIINNEKYEYSNNMVFVATK
jgi:ubiquinone/menaquinone biosynthesis C-methylase UbiE